MVDQRKIAQIASYFLTKAGGSDNLLKLTKLLYLAEREALAVRGRGMSGDKPVSMPHGPVLTRTLDLANGAGPEVDGGWKDWIEDRSNYNVRLRRGKRELTRDSFDYLSDSEIELLDNVWEQFGGMSGFQLRDWTHDNCPEWENPNGSSAPIPFERIFRAVGYSSDASSKLVSETNSEHKLNELLYG